MINTKKSLIIPKSNNSFKAEKLEKEKKPKIKISKDNLKDENLNTMNLPNLPKPNMKSTKQSLFQQLNSNNSISNYDSQATTNVSISVFTENSKKKEERNPSYNFNDLRLNIGKCTIDLNNEDSLNLENYKINKGLKDDFTDEDYKRYQSLFVRTHHSKDILSTLLAEEKPFKNSLSKHKITERMRMRMIDWMIEVINNYKCDESVFFLSVDLMDNYFSLTDKILDPNELHLIGVTCMFTASKFQDIYPLRLKMVHEKIAHKKLSTDEIKTLEAEIISLNKFKIGFPSIWDFCSYFIEEMFLVEDNKFLVLSDRLKEKSQDLELFKFTKEKINPTFKLYTSNMINLLKHVAIYLAKMNLHDFLLIHDHKPSLIAAATVFVSLKICEQINKTDYLTDCFIKNICNLSGSQENTLIKVSQKILHNAQNFDQVFNGLDNLKKIHFNAIIELKHTK